MTHTSEGETLTNMTWSPAAWVPSKCFDLSLTSMRVSMKLCRDDSQIKCGICGKPMSGQGGEPEF